MPRYKLRTLLFLLAIGPPILAATVPSLYRACWRAPAVEDAAAGVRPTGGGVPMKWSPLYVPPPGAKLRDGFTLDTF